MTSPKFVVGDLVTPATGPWHGLVGRVTSTTDMFFGDDSPKAWLTEELLIEFDEPIENHKGLPVWDHWFSPEELIKLDEAGKLIYV